MDKYTKTDVEFVSKENLDGWSVLKIRIFEQAMADYFHAWRVLNEFKSYPHDIGEWTDKMCNRAYFYITRETAVMNQIENFFCSPWFGILYPKMDGDIVEAAIKRKCTSKYGKIISQKRTNEIIELLKVWRKQLIEERKAHENHIV